MCIAFDVFCVTPNWGEWTNVHTPNGGVDVNPYGVRTYGKRGPPDLT